MLQKLLLFTIIFLFASTLADAQISRGRRLGAGGALKLGLNVSYLNPGLAESESPRISFHAGLAPTIPLRNRLYLKPELAFSTKGGRVSYAQPFFDGTVTYRLNYLELPVVVGIKPAESVALELGAYGALRVGGNFDFQGTFFSGYGSFDPGTINDFDYGLVGGVAVITKPVAIGIRYYYGLQQIATGALATEFLGNATHHTVQVYIQRGSRKALRQRRNERTVGIL